MGMAKRLVDEGMELPLPVGLDLEQEAFVDVRTTDDAQGRDPELPRARPRQSRVQRPLNLSGFDLLLQAGEIALPQAPQDRLPRLLAGDAAEPPREAQPLLPAELRGAITPRVQPELAVAGDGTAVRDPHRDTGLPHRHHEVVGGVERADARQAVELRADTRVLRRCGT